MKQKKKKIYFQIKYWLGVVVVGLVVGLSIQFVVAWSEPTNNPPEGESESWKRICKYTQCKPVCEKNNDAQCPAGWDRAALLMAGKGCQFEGYKAVKKVSPDGCFVYAYEQTGGIGSEVREKVTIEGFGQASVRCQIFSMAIPPGPPTPFDSSCAICCKNDAANEIY